jgi:hypothetical protein
MIIVCEPKSRWRTTALVWQFSGGTPEQNEQAIQLTRGLHETYNIRVQGDEDDIVFYIKPYLWRRVKWLELARSESLQQPSRHR